MNEVLKKIRAMPIVLVAPGAESVTFMPEGQRIVQVPVFPDRLYGFFYTGDYHECGAMLQTLHYTKRGALRAMIARQYAAWEDSRSNKDSGIHMPRMYRRERGLDDFRAERDMHRYFVSIVLTNP